MVVLQFLWTGTHLGEKMESTWRMSQARPHHQARPALQVRPALPRATSSVPNTSFPVCTTWMKEIYQGNVGLIEWMKLWSLGSMGPPLRPINGHNCHSKSILSITKWRRFIPRLRGGPVAPRGPATPTNCHTGQNRWKEPTLNRLRSKDQERPRREAVDHRASRTPWSGRTCDIGPTRSTDLTYL
jgi:hypothetical protein